MKEMADDGIKDSNSPLGPAYRVVRPCLRDSERAFVAEDLRSGAERCRILVTEDRPGIRAAADRARQVVHARIARLHRIEAGPEGRLLLISDWIDGETLAERLARLGPLHESWILEALGSVAAGLDQAHAMGVPHGDLGPDSIVIDEAESPMVLGLAVAAACRDELESDSARPTTKPAPGGEVSVQADVHAFAAILFAALNGHPPSLHGGVDDGPVTPDETEASETPLRRALRRAALRGLDRDPAGRPSSCGELMREVEAAVDVVDGLSRADEATAGEDTRARRSYDTPLALLDLESEVADVVPRKARLGLKDQPAVIARWEKGEHFLSSGAVYKQLQQWQAAGEALERARAEFVGAIELDRGLVASRARHERLSNLLATFLWAEHPAAAESKNRLRALLEGGESAWATSWADGLLQDAEARLDDAEAVLHEAGYLNREIASAEEWRARWTEVSRQIPDRTLDLRWAEEIRDHRAAGRRGEQAFENARFRTAGGCWSRRIGRLRVVLAAESEAHDSAMDGRRRFDDAMSRVPRSRPISKSLRESLDRLLVESDRIEADFVSVGDFETASRLWTEATGGIGGLVQQDVERFGSMETAREGFARAESSGRPARRTWSRLEEEFDAIRRLASAAGIAREAGDFDVAIAGWTEARQRLERAFPADLERHREATLARERFDRRIDTLPQRALDRSVRADIDRLRQRRGVLEEWLVAGRFTEVEDAVRRAIDTIEKALEIDGGLHDAAIEARDRAVGVNIAFPEEVPQPVLDALKPLFGDVDATAVQARQAFELGEYADCTDAWNRTMALKEQATEDLRRETEKYHRLRRRQSMLRTAGAVAAVVVLAFAGAEFGARWWFGGMRTTTAAINPASTGLVERRDELVARFDGVLAGPVVLVNLPAGMALRSEPTMLADQVARSQALRGTLDGIPAVEARAAWPRPLQDDIQAFRQSLADANRQWDAADLEALATTVEPLALQGEMLAARCDRAAMLLEAMDGLPSRPLDLGGFRQVADGWDRYEEMTQAAGTAFAADELDEVEEWLGKAGVQAVAMQILQARLAAENARDAFNAFWGAAEFQPLKRASLDADRDRVEALAEDATAHFESETFTDAREDWLEAFDLAQEIADEFGGDFALFGRNRRAWDDRERPTPFVREDAKFKASFNRAEETARRGIDRGSEGDFAEAAEGLEKALEQWNRQLAAVDRHTRDAWQLLDDEMAPVAARLKAAEWLADALQAGMEPQLNAEFTRDRLAWQVDPPRHLEVRSWPISPDREIELQFISTARNIVLGPADRGMRVMVSGFWISTTPLDEIRNDFGSARSDAAGLGLVSAIAPDGGDVRTWKFRLPTEAEWMRAVQVDVIRRGNGPEWCRDRFQPEEWWMHLVREDPGGPMLGPQGVIRRGDLPVDRFPPLRPGGAEVRPVLSVVFEPEVIRPEELELRRDPRLAGVPEEWVADAIRTVELGDVSIDFVPVTVMGKRLWVATTECTQAVWRSVTGELPEQPVERGDLPVVGITEIAITEDFLRVIRGRFGLKLRLPESEEWRTFAAAGEPDPFCFGDEFPDRHLQDFAWYDLNSGEAPHAVGVLRPNRWGLFDVHGNVAERCAPDANAMTDVRGGSFRSPIEECRLDEGARFMSAQFFDWLGFRLVADELPE